MTRLYQKLINNKKHNCLRAAALPGELTAVVLVEAAVVLVGQPLDEADHGLGALLDGERRLFPPHVRLHPARVKAHRQDAVVLEVLAQRARHCVQRRLAGAVRVEATLVVLGDGAEHRAHVDDNGALAALGRALVALGGLLQLGEECLGEHQRRDRVGQEVLRHLLHLHQVHPGELGRDAGAVEQHVDAVILDDGLHLLGEVVVTVEILHVDLQHVDILVLGGYRRESLGLLRVPASGDQVFGRRRPLDELLHQAQPQAAVAPGDEDGLHVALTLLFASALCWARFSIGRLGRADNLSERQRCPPRQVVRLLLLLRPPATATTATTSPGEIRNASWQMGR